MPLYFRDNFFSAGVTEIMNEQGERIGEVDLKTMFGSSLDIRELDGKLVCHGSFRFFSNKWEVTDGGERLLGVLRARMAMFSKKFEYASENNQTYYINSPAFSKAYEIKDHQEQIVAAFERTSNWLMPSAFRLDNITHALDDYELIAVVLGVNAIHKRHNDAAAGSH
ncbi:hypothetical protein [Paenibacillus sp. GCM10027626]|uniref:hypothetical protein n=1 Tax=Paenibacillus sp. GCM10027626 TaxID=3273411 RepID=UPI0036366A0C